MVVEAQLLGLAFVRVELGQAPADVHPEQLVFGCAALEALDVAAEVETRPVADAEERHGDLIELGARLHLVPPRAVEVVHHEVVDVVLVVGGGVVDPRVLEELLAGDVGPPPRDARLSEQSPRIRPLPVHVRESFPRDERGEVRRFQAGDDPLGDRVIRHAGQAHLAGTPGLCGGPLDGVVVVPGFGHAPDLGVAGRAAGAPAIDEDENVAARYPIVGLGSFLMGERSGVGHVLEFLLVNAQGQQRRELLARGIGPEHVSHHVRAAPGRDLHVLVYDHLVLGLGELRCVGRRRGLRRRVRLREGTHRCRVRGEGQREQARTDAAADEPQARADRAGGVECRHDLLLGSKPMCHRHSTSGPPGQRPGWSSGNWPSSATCRLS